MNQHVLAQLPKLRRQPTVHASSCLASLGSINITVHKSDQYGHSVSLFRSAALRGFCIVGCWSMSSGVYVRLITHSIITTTQDIAPFGDFYEPAL